MKVNNMGKSENLPVRVSLREIYLNNGRIHPLYFLSGIDFWRIKEFRLAINNLEIEKGMRVLDIGSGTTSIPQILAIKGADVYSIDINSEAVQRLNEAFKRRFGENLMCTFEVQDITRTSFPDEYFDRVVAISTIEHIPSDGDSVAMAEIKRILKRGAVAIITIPCGKSYKEYELSKWGMFERIYDRSSIMDRLIRPSGMKVVKEQFFGDKRAQAFSRLWYNLPIIFRGIFGLFAMFFGIIYWDYIDSGDENDSWNVLLVFKK